MVNLNYRFYYIIWKINKYLLYNHTVLAADQILTKKQVSCS